MAAGHDSKSFFQRTAIQTFGYAPFSKCTTYDWLFVHYVTMLPPCCSPQTKRLILIRVPLPNPHPYLPSLLNIGFFYHLLPLHIHTNKLVIVV